MSAPRSRPSPLLTDPVGALLFRLAWPILFGIGAIFLFNTVDTFYVGRLGARELAAMSFTFPVTFIVMNIAIGIGMGASSVIARAVGEGDGERVQRLTTDSLVLGLVITAVLTPAALLSIAPVFSLLGAAQDLLPLIRSYVIPWFSGMGLLVVPIIANAALRATGDTRTPSAVMILSGLANAVIDPLLIFGIGPFPALGLKGAALATLISWALAASAALWALGNKGLLSRSVPTPGAVRASMKAILYVGIPAAATNVLVPIAAGVVTRLAAGHGEEAVAAYGIAGRVEFLAMVGVFALATAMAPLAGQNHGAERHDRVDDALRVGVMACLGWGLSVAGVLALGARPLSAAFNEDPEVVRIATLFFRIVPIGFGFVGVAILVNSLFNAINQPLKSAMLVVVRLFGMGIPLAIFGNQVAGLFGLFIGLCLGNVLMGAVSFVVARRHVTRDRRRTVARGDAVLGPPRTT